MWNSFSKADGPHISSLVGESFSGFRTTRSFEPDGEGTAKATPDNSIGNGDHSKLMGLAPFFLKEADSKDFLILFAKTFGWLTENIAFESLPAQVNRMRGQQFHRKTQVPSSKKQ